MDFTLHATDMPDEVREVIRLQNQRIQRLEAALGQLLTVLSSAGVAPSELPQVIQPIYDSQRQQRLIQWHATQAGWNAEDDTAWSRLDEPQHVWDGLRHDEERAAWLAERYNS